MELPQISFTIPSEVLVDSPVPDASFEFVLELPNNQIYHGKVIRMEIDRVHGVTSITGEHIANELTHRRVPTNFAVKEITLGEIYNPKTYTRPDYLETVDGVITNQHKHSSSNQPTKTGHKVTTTEKISDTETLKTTVYTMSDDTTRTTTTRVVKEELPDGSVKTTTTTSRYNGSVLQTVTVKNKNGSVSETTKTLKNPDKPFEDATTYITYEKVAELDGKFNEDGWSFVFVDDAEDVVFTYLFSNQDKLTSLTDMCKQTEDVFWRVSLTEERTIEIGKFGEYKEWFITDDNIMGNTFNITHDFTTITNYGIYFTDKSDSGTTALTLRDIYNRPDLQNPNFPIVLTGEEINTERNYNYIDLIPFGANNKGDYAVVDQEGVAMEAGNIYEEAFTSNDIQPVANNNEELSEEDRLVASRQLYAQAIRKLKHSRRKTGYSFEVDEIPVEYNVGDKVRFAFVDEILKIDKCTNYYKKLLTLDDYFYITDMTTIVTTDGAIHYSLVIEKFLYHDGEV